MGPAPAEWTGFPKRRALLVLAWLTLAATLLALLATAQSGFWVAYGGKEVPWLGLLRARLVDCYAFALFVPAVYRLALRFPVDRRRWPAALPIHLAACLLFAVLKEAVFVAVGSWFRPGIFVLGDILAEDLLSEVMFFWALTGLVHAYIFHRMAERQAPAAEAVPALDHFAVRERDGYRLVRVDEVDWIDAQGNYARLNTRNGRHLVRETMAALERRLDGRFVRVHRRTIVNRDRIERIEARSHGEYTIVLTCGEAIPTGRSHGPKLRALLG